MFLWLRLAVINGHRSIDHHALGPRGFLRSGQHQQYDCTCKQLLASLAQKAIASSSVPQSAKAYNARSSTASGLSFGAAAPAVRATDSLAHCNNLGLRPACFLAKLVTSSQHTSHFKMSLSRPSLVLSSKPECLIKQAPTAAAGMHRSRTCVVHCGKNKSTNRKSKGSSGRGKPTGPQKEPIFKSESGTISSDPSPSQKRDRALKHARMSLQHVGVLGQALQEQGTLGTNPIVAAVQAKAEEATAVFQAALDSSWDSLTNREINVIMAWELVATLAQGLANVMTADSVYNRVIPARRMFGVLEEQGYQMRGAEDMFRLAPLVARLLCSALPGFKVFLWLPPKMRYGIQAMQADQALRKEPPLLSEALGIKNTILCADDWDNFVPPDEDDIMKGLASGSCFGRMYGYNNSSCIYILAADDAAPSIHKDLQFGSRLPNATNAWAVMACDPFATSTSEARFDPFSLLDVQLLMAEEGKQLKSVRARLTKLAEQGFFWGPEDVLRGVELPGSQSRLSGILEMY